LRALFNFKFKCEFEKMVFESKDFKFVSASRGLI